MTTSMDPGAIAGLERSLVPARRPRPLARLGVRIARALWLEDRAVAEARWGAITLAAMGLLSLVAKIIDAADDALDAAIVVTLTAAALTAAAAWSAGLRPLIHRPWLRMGIGPAVLLLAMASTGRIDVVDLQPAPGLPLIILALSFAAITPGYPIAAAIYLTLAIGVGVAHASLSGADGSAGPASDEYVVRATVTFLAATGMWVVVRVATAAEDRAARYAARSRRRVDADAVAALEGEGGVRVTTSAGVASLLGDEADGQALFRAADSALLAAKRAGRDRVVAV